MLAPWFRFLLDLQPKLSSMYHTREYYIQTYSPSSSILLWPFTGVQPCALDLQEASIHDLLTLQQHESMTPGHFSRCRALALLHSCQKWRGAAIQEPAARPSCASYLPWQVHPCNIRKRVTLTANPHFLIPTFLYMSRLHQVFFAGPHVLVELPCSTTETVSYKHHLQPDVWNDLNAQVIQLPLRGAQRSHCSRRTPTMQREMQLQGTPRNRAAPSAPTSSWQPRWHRCVPASSTAVHKA